MSGSEDIVAAKEDAVHEIDGNFRDRIEETYKKVKVRLGDRNWRLNNLYWIINEHGERVKFQCRPQQQHFIEHLWYRNIILKARQLGFTTLIDLFGLDLVLFNSNVNGGIIAHKREDAGVIYRDKIKFPYNSLPEAIRDERPYTKMDAGELRLANNSGIRVGTSMRSGTIQFLHISEHGKICAKWPEKAREIKTGSIPAVHQGSFLFVESTAEGRSGDFFDLCEVSQRDAASGKPLNPLSMKFHFYPWWRNEAYRLDSAGILIPDRLTKYFDALEPKLGVELDAAQRAWYAETEGGALGLGSDMKREHPSTPEEAFEQSVEGAYYKPQMDKAYADGRVCSVPHDPDYPVNTHWDIGHDDKTAIWFYQDIAGWHRYIDYYEHSGEGLPHYVSVLEEKQRERGFKYGRMIGPHDMDHTNWGTGKTTHEHALNEHGILFEIAPNIRLMDGIESTRRYLARCVFDHEYCDVGLTRLSSYRKEWDDKAGEWKSTPRHDENSHGADSFRYGAVSEKRMAETDSSPSNGTDGNRIDKVRKGIL